jgi:hypothetical protein
MHLAEGHAALRTARGLLLGHEPGEAEADLDQAAIAPDLAQQVLHQIPEGGDAGAAQFEGLAGGGIGVRGTRDRLGDIADIDRLELRVAAADEGQERRELRHHREAVEEAVLGAEHHRRPQDHRVRIMATHAGLARGLAARIGRVGAGIGAYRRDMDEPRGARGLGGGGKALGAFALDRIETLPPGLVEDAHEVDDDIGAPHGLGDRRGVGDVDTHRHDLADASHRLEECGRDRVAHRHAHDIPAGRQALHDVAPDEARSAENSDSPRSRLHAVLQCREGVSRL